MEYALNKEEKAIEDEKQVRKDISAMILTALSSGAPQSVIDVASKATSSLEAAKLLGSYSPETLKYELLKEQIKTENAQRAKINADINKTNNPTGSLADIKDFQVQNAGFADRINMSNQILDSNVDTLKSMNYAQFKLATSTSPLASKALSPAQKQVALAMRNFITAKLRKESGASILPTEFADARAQYFPTIGDDDVTIANKKALRDSTLNNLIVGSGGAYQPTQLTTNKFEQATGGTTQSFVGSSIISGINSNGSLNFSIPRIK